MHLQGFRRISMGVRGGGGRREGGASESRIRNIFRNRVSGGFGGRRGGGCCWDTGAARGRKGRRGGGRRGSLGGEGGAVTGA